MLEFHHEPVRFSLYKNSYSTSKPDLNIDIDQLVEIIKFGYLKKEIQKLRKCDDGDLKNDLEKATLPAVAISGIFNERSKEGLLEHSGLIQIHIDHLKNSQALFEKICSNKYTFIAFKNPKGDGLRLILRILPQTETHKNQFIAIQNYYKNNFNVAVESTCFDITKCLVLSHDPDIYYNPSAITFEKLHKSKNQEVENIISIPKKQVESSSPKKEEEKIAKIVNQVMEKDINLVDTYEKRMQIGFALVNALGINGNEYFHQINSISSNYEPIECDQFYINLLQTDKGYITISTLFFYAKEAGIEVDRLINNQSPFKKIYNLPFLYNRLKRKRIEISNKYGQV